jgi:signal transduction histidine kinase
MPETIDDIESSLRRAVDFMPHGLAVFDKALRLTASNIRYRELLDLPAHLVRPGTLLFDIALFLALRGDLGDGVPAEMAQARVAELTEETTSITQRLGSGRADAGVSHWSRLPDGGLVISFADVSAGCAEGALETANQSLESRVKERTKALTRVNSELEMARAKADEANHDKTRFLAAASHDLLQPLNAARLYTATLLERVGTIHGPCRARQ